MANHDRTCIFHFVAVKIISSNFHHLEIKQRDKNVFSFDHYVILIFSVQSL